VAGSSEYGDEPSDSINGRQILEKPRTVSFSKRTLVHGVSQLVKTFTKN
jgi:hypothetical protein